MPSLKTVLKENPAAMDMVAGLYSLLYGNCNWGHRLRNKFVQ